MDSKHYQRYYQRIKAGKFTEEEAYHCPAHTPLWMYRLEKEEGIPLMEIIAQELARGFCVAEIARSFEVHRDTLDHWIKKLKRQEA